MKTFENSIIDMQSYEDIIAFVNVDRNIQFLLIL